MLLPAWSNPTAVALNIRNIVLMRPINLMIEFMQIVGRGTRLFDGKDYVAIWNFVGAHHHFNDPEWDGDPQTGTLRGLRTISMCVFAGRATATTALCAMRQRAMHLSQQAE